MASISRIAFLSFLLIILIVPFISAAPAIKSVSNSEYGLDIEHPLSSNFKVGETHKFHFHIFDINNSKAIMTNMGYNCSFHLYNQTGAHLFKNNNNVGSDDNLDWEQVIEGKNFSTAGIYSFVFQCNNSFQGGYYSHDFLVTQWGTNDLYTLLILLAVILFIAGAFIVIGVSMDNSKWLIKSVMYFSALLILILAVVISSSATITSNASKMMTTLFIIVISTLGIFTVYIFVTYFIALVRATKEVKQEKFSDDLM